VLSLIVYVRINSRAFLRGRGSSEAGWRRPGPPGSGGACACGIRRLRIQWVNDLATARHLGGVLQVSLKIHSRHIVSFHTALCALVLGGIVLGGAPAWADTTDTRTAWTNFFTPPGFVRPYTYRGRIIADHESSSDPSNGGAAVSPANADLTSESPNGSDPGLEPTVWYGYYDGGTEYDPDDPVTMDDDYLFFRMRLGDDISAKTGFISAHWNVVIDIDGDGYKEYWLDVAGDTGNNDDLLQLLYNNDNTQEMPDRDKNPEIVIEDFVGRNDEDAGNLSHTRLLTIGGSTQYFLDVQIPLTAFDDMNGNQIVFPDSTIAWIYSTSKSNTDPLQKDWMMELQEGAYVPADPITPGDPLNPSGKPPVVYFTDATIATEVDWYEVGDNIYTAVNYQAANTNSAAVDSVTVVVRCNPTNDEETLTLYEIGPNAGMFSNNGGADDPVSSAPTRGWIPYADTSKSTLGEDWTVAYNGANWTATGSVSGLQTAQPTAGTLYTSDNGEVSFTLYEDNPQSGDNVTFTTYAADPLTCSNTSGADDDGDLQTFAGQKISVTYTADSTDYVDWADIVGTGLPFIQFTHADGTPAMSYILQAVQADSDPIYVTVYHNAANTDPGSAQTIVVTLSGNDAETMDGTYILTETGNDTGVFRNTTGLPSKATDGTVATDSVWEDGHGGVITATYNYDSTDYTTVSNMIVTPGGGTVYFKNAGGTVDIGEYAAGDVIWLKVEDPNYATSTLTVTVTGDAAKSNDSETVTLYEIGDTQVFMNLKTDLVTTASSGVVTSACSTFQTDGVQAGDSFAIGTGPDAGTYTVQSVDSETQITLTTTLTGTRTGIRFSAQPLIAQDDDGTITADDDIMEGQDNEKFTATYTDTDDGDQDAGNNNKTDCAFYNATPTRAVVSSFGAYGEGERAVVWWVTSSEVGTAGFYLLRRDGRGPYERVSEQMLPALLDSPQGGTYRCVDPKAQAGKTYTYLLEEIEVRGTKRRHGPFEVTVTDGPAAGAPDYSRLAHGAVKQALHRSDVGRWAMQGLKRAIGRRPPKPKPVPSFGSAVKMAITQKGLYYLDTSEIAQLMGLRERFVQLLIRRAMLSLSCQGRSVAYLPADGEAGIYFFGQGIDSIYTDENIYWLTLGRGSQMVDMGQSEVKIAEGFETFTETVHAERNYYPATGIYDDPEGDFWLWDYVVSGAGGLSSRSFTIGTDDPAPDGTARLTVRLKGGSSTGASPEHHAEIALNGTVIGQGRWDGTDSCTLTFGFAQSLLNGGSNTIAVTGILDTGAPYSIFYINSFDLAYQRYYQAVDDSLLCRADGNDALTISWFSSPQIRLLDVTNPWRPMVVSGATVEEVHKSYRISFTPLGEGSAYLAATDDALKAPVWIKADSPSRLKRRGVLGEHVIIAPAQLCRSAAYLARHRREQGLYAMVVDVEDVYDEFNYGIVSPKAIRSFVSYASSNWRSGLRYVVLAGDGTFDYKDYLGYGDNLLPPLLVDTEFGLFASDREFGKGGVAIGRIPAGDAGELEAVIAKIVAYEASGGAWTRRVLMAADDPDEGGNFSQDSDDLAALLPAGYTIEKAYLSQLTLAAARQKLMGEINEGVVLMNYIGHGGLDRLAREGLLTTGDAQGLSNGPRLPVVTALTCSSGQFAIPGFDCVGEALVLRDGGGAIAVWGPSGYSFNSEAKLLGRGFLRDALVRGQPVLGEAVEAAFESFGSGDEVPDTLKVYNLLGDPALRMRVSE